MLQNLRRFGVPDYVTPQHIADFAGRPVDALINSGFFEGIPYKLTANRIKHYHYKTCLQMLRVYQIDPPCKTHPYAKWRPTEIIADLDVTAFAYLNLIKKGKLVEEGPDERGKFIYYKDYERFLKNYVPYKMLQWLPPKLKMRDAAEFIGITPGRLKGEVRRGNAEAVWWNRNADGKRRYRWMTRDQIIQYVTKIVSDATHKSKKLIRSTPLADKLSIPLTAMYLKTTETKVKYFIHRGYLEPGKTSDARSPWRKYDVFEKTYLDEKYDYYCRGKFYNEGKSYYNRAAIRNKFGKTNFWISTYIVGKCHEMLTNDGKPMTVEERTAENLKLNRLPSTSLGWVQSEVEAIVNSGVEVDPTVELTEYRKRHMDALDKTNYNELRSRLKEYREKKFAKITIKPIADEVELALKAAFEEKDYRREEHKKEVWAMAAQEMAERNQIREMLGIKPQVDVPMTPKNILKYSNEPEKVTIVYSRTGWDIYSKHSLEPTDCTFKAKDTNMIICRLRPKVFSVFANIARVAGTIVRLEPKTVPSWIILVPSSSIISDPSFYMKLDEVPPEYGAVAPYGYEYTLPDGSWVKCPATYGMYSQYSKENSLLCKRVVGTRSVVGNHEVAVLDGPFVAVRGGYLKMIAELKKFHVLGDGRSYVPYAISMIMKRLGVKMLQIEVDSLGCTDFDPETRGLDWNRAERMLISFANPNLQFKL